MEEGWIFYGYDGHIKIYITFIETYLIYNWNWKLNDWLNKNG